MTCVAVPIEGQQQAVERRERRDPQPGVARFQHFVHEIRIDPVEDREIEEERAVLRRQPAEQAYPDVVLGESDRVHAGRIGPGSAQVPVDHERDRPSDRALLDGGQLASRQRAVEEPSDLRPREAKLRGLDEGRRAVEEVSSQVESGIEPERHGEVEVGRTALQQQVDRLHRGRRQQLHLIQHEQARVGVQLYRTGEHPQLPRERGRGPCVVINHPGEIETRVLESAREVVSEHARRVTLVHREPGDHHALLLLPLADVHQDRGLTESAGCLQHGEPPLEHRTDTLEERGPMHVSVGQHRRHHFRHQQPGGKAAGCGSVRAAGVPERPHGIRGSTHAACSSSPSAGLPSP